MTINQERVAMWVAALRSPDYMQVSRTLTIKDEDGFEHDCCLGVACKVALANGVKLDWEWFTDPEMSLVRRYTNPRNGARTVTGVLPDEVYEWFGFDEPNPVIADLRRDDDDDYYDDDAIICATEANDNLGWDFERIANAVEQYYLEES